MPNEKISAMTGAAALTGTELVPLVQSGGNVQATVATILADWFAAVDANGFGLSNGGNFEFDACRATDELISRLADGTPRIELGINGAGTTDIPTVVFEDGTVTVASLDYYGGDFRFAIDGSISFMTDASGAVKAGYFTGVNLNGYAISTVIGIDCNGGDYYYTNGVKVVGEQEAAIADASGGATVDSQARTAINTLLAAMRNHGLIAT